MSFDVAWETWTSTKIGKYHTLNAGNYKVEARQKAPVKKQRQPGTGFMPQVDPPCPYERCRDDIVADKKDFYREVFGVPYDSQTGIIAQMLGHADDDSTDEVIICSL